MKIHADVNKVLINDLNALMTVTVEVWNIWKYFHYCDIIYLTLYRYTEHRLDCRLNVIHKRQCNNVQSGCDLAHGSRVRVVTIVDYCFYMHLRTNLSILYILFTLYLLGRQTDSIFSPGDPAIHLIIAQKANKKNRS